MPIFYLCEDCKVQFCSLFSCTKITHMSDAIAVNRRGFPYKIEDFEKYTCLKNEKDARPEIHEGVWYHSEPDVYRLLKVNWVNNKV